MPEVATIARSGLLFAEPRGNVAATHACTTQAGVDVDVDLSTAAGVCGTCIVASGRHSSELSDCDGWCCPGAVVSAAASPAAGFAANISERKRSLCRKLEKTSN